MTLEPVQRLVDELARDLLGPLLDGRPRRGFHLASWDAEQGICLTYERRDAVLLLELEQRDDALDCYARTARFNVCARRQFEGDAPMTAGHRALVDHVVAVVRRREGRLPVFERPVTGRKTALREVRVDQVLISEGRGHYHLNPYVGCMIGCPYCYVQQRADFSRHLEGLPRVQWGRYLDVKVNAAEVLREEVRRLPPGVVRMCPILTDPYQPVERRYRVTRRCLEVLLGANFAPALLTRSARILEDLELIQRFDRALVGFSIPTDMDRYRLIFEPGADPVEERFEALQAFHAAGVSTIALIQPALPMNVEVVAERVAPYVRAVRVDRMYFTDLVADLYREHGLEHCATDAFFDETVRALREALRARGVRVDDLDDLGALMEP